MQNMEQKRRQLEESQDSLNEELAKLRAQGTTLALVVVISILEHSVLCFNDVKNYKNPTQILCQTTPINLAKYSVEFWDNNLSKCQLSLWQTPCPIPKLLPLDVHKLCLSQLPDDFILRVAWFSPSNLMWKICVYQKQFL